MNAEELMREVYYLMSHLDRGLVCKQMLREVSTNALLAEAEARYQNGSIDDAYAVVMFCKRISDFERLIEDMAPTESLTPPSNAPAPA